MGVRGGEEVFKRTEKRRPSLIEKQHGVRKPLRESRGEVERATQILRYFAGEAYRSTGESFEQSANGAQVFTRRRPATIP